MTEEKLLDAAKKTLADSDLLAVTRRIAMAIGAGGLTIVLDRAKADVEGQGVGEARRNSGADYQQQQTLVSRTDVNTARTEQPSRQQMTETRGIEAVLGSDFRARQSSMQNLTATQLYATGTRDRAPDPGRTRPGEYSSDEFNRKLWSSSDNPLAQMYRDWRSLPEGVTVSIGKEGTGAPGRTPLFSLTMVEFSRNGVGLSQTTGLGATTRGGKAVGAFLSVSALEGQRRWSVGAFGGSSAAVGVAAVNVTELVKQGRVNVELGTLVSAGRGEVEVGVEFYPVEKAVNALDSVLGPVLGPLSDYRNFQDPLLEF